MELITFHQLRGLSQRTIDEEGYIYTDNPDKEDGFIEELDNLTSVIKLSNLTLFSLISSEGESIGIIQIMNRNTIQSFDDFIVNYFAKSRYY